MTEEWQVHKYSLCSSLEPVTCAESHSAAFQSLKAKLKGKCNKKKQELKTVAVKASAGKKPSVWSCLWFPYFRQCVTAYDEKRSIKHSDHCSPDIYELNCLCISFTE